MVENCAAVSTPPNHSNNTRFKTQRSQVRETVLALGASATDTPSPGSPTTSRTGGAYQLSSVASAIPIFRSVIKNGQLSREFDSGHFFSGACGLGQQLLFPVRNGQGTIPPTLTKAKRAIATNCARKLRILFHQLRQLRLQMRNPLAQHLPMATMPRRPQIPPRRLQRQLQTRPLPLVLTPRRHRLLPLRPLGLLRFHVLALPSSRHRYCCTRTNRNPISGSLAAGSSANRCDIEMFIPCVSKFPPRTIRIVPVFGP